MTCSLPAVGYSVADVKVCDGRVLFEDTPGARITQNSIFAELCPRFLERADWPLRPHHVENLPDMRWVIRDFLENGFTMDACGFRTAADQRIFRNDDDVMGASNWIGNFVHDDFLEPSSDHLLHKKSLQCYE